MVKILIYVLLFNTVVYAQNTKNMIILDESGRSILRIFTVCEYKVVLKSPVDKEVKINTTMIGNGFFVGEHSSFYELAVTANHMFLCNLTIGELSSRKVLEEIDREHDEDLSPGNIVAIKNGKISNIVAHLYGRGSVSNVRILYHTEQPKTLGDPDRALFRVDVPDGFSHVHLPLMEDKDFDKIFYREDIIGMEVITRGFLTFNDGWFLRYKNALIELVSQEVFQINELLDQGLSGGPVIYFHNNKAYAVGIISIGPTQQSNHVFDMSWITIIKKSFLDKRNKK